MLFSVRYTSSACTGSYSGEMGLASIQPTLNTSGLFERKADFTTVRVHERSLSNGACNVFYSGHSDGRCSIQLKMTDSKRM